MGGESEEHSHYFKSEQPCFCSIGPTMGENEGERDRTREEGTHVPSVPCTSANQHPACPPLANPIHSNHFAHALPVLNRQ